MQSTFNINNIIYTIEYDIGQYDFVIKDGDNSFYFGFRVNGPVPIYHKIEEPYCIKIDLIDKFLNKLNNNEQCNLPTSMEGSISYKNSYRSHPDNFVNFDCGTRGGAGFEARIEFALPTEITIDIVTKLRESIVKYKDNN